MTVHEKALEKLLERLNLRIETRPCPTDRCYGGTYHGYGGVATCGTCDGLGLLVELVSE